MATFDFYLQPKTEENIQGFKVITSGFNRSLAVRGPWKLLVQWMKRFLTAKGSDPLRPNDGTDFSALIGSNITSIADVRDVLLLAIQDCNDQIYEIQEEIAPDEDELLDAAVLSDLTLDTDDSISVYINISNVAGDSVTLQLPLLSDRV